MASFEHVCTRMPAARQSFLLREPKKLHQPKSEQAPCCCSARAAMLARFCPPCSRAERPRGVPPGDDDEDVEAQIFRNLWKRHRLLPPTSKYKSYWDIVMFTFVIYNAIYIPIELSFDVQKAVGHCIFDYFVDLCFMVDMAINTRTTYYNEQNELVIDPKTIVRKYVCSHWFAIDFLAVFPFDLVVGAGGCGDTGESEDSGGFTAFVALLKTFRLLRLLRFRKELDKLAGANFLRVLVSLSVFLLVAHWLACVWWAVGAAMFREEENRAINGVVLCDGLEPCAWLRRTPTGGAKLTLNTPFVQQYLSSLYWSLTTLMKSPALGPDPVPEKIVATFAIALGAVCYAVFLSTVQNNFQSLTKNAAQKRDQLASIGAFSTTREVPPELAQQLTKQTTALYEWTQGLKNSQVLLQLPSHLRGSIAIKLYGELTGSGSALFSKTSVECAKGIATRLACQVLVVDQQLIAKGECCNMLYLLQKGILKVELNRAGSLDLPPAPPVPPPRTRPNPDSPTAARRSSTGGRKNVVTFREIVNPGTPVGLIDPLRNKNVGKYPFWVKASKKTYLYQISQALLAQALDGFPDDAQQIRSLLAAEQKKLVDSLFVNAGEEMGDDAPLNIMAKADEQAEAAQKPEELSDELMDRVMDVERKLISAMDHLSDMTDNMKCLPQMIELLKPSGAKGAASIPHSTESKSK